jgi:hypothetical protein
LFQIRRPKGCVFFEVVPFNILLATKAEKAGIKTGEPPQAKSQVLRIPTGRGIMCYACKPANRMKLEQTAILEKVARG